MNHINLEVLEEIMNKDQSNVPDISPLSYIYCLLINHVEPSDIDFSRFTFSDLKKVERDLPLLIASYYDDSEGIEIARGHTYTEMLRLALSFDKFIDVKSVFLPSPYRFI